MSAQNSSGKSHPMANAAMNQAAAGNLVVGNMLGAVGGMLSGIGHGGMLSGIGHGGVVAPAPVASQAAMPTEDLPAIFTVEKIANGFVIRAQKTTWNGGERFYAQDIKEVGERITAMLVKYYLEGK